MSLDAETHAETLAAHADFARAVARAILGREDLAADAAQDAMVAAWRGRPREKSRWRSWFGAIVRHKALDLHRREATRTSYEAAHPARPPDGDPAALAERADTGRRVVEHVLALPEPYRQVLLLRFHEGRSVAEVAGLLALPVETVRTRQKRALAQVRARIDDGGSCWRPSLALLAAGGPAGEPTTWIQMVGGWLMGKKVTIAVGALLLLGGALWWGWSEDEEPRTAAATGAADLPASEPVREAGPSLEARAPERAPDASPKDAPKPVETATAPDLRVALVGTVVDEQGAPVVGASVRYQDRTRVLPSATTGADGGFRVFAERLPALRWSAGLILASDSEGRVAILEKNVYTNAPDEEDVGALVLRAPLTLRVRVAPADATTSPIEVLAIKDGLQGGQVVERAKTGPDGVCTFRQLVAGNYRLLARAHGHGRGVLVTSLPRTREDELVLTLPEERRVEVTVIDKVSREPVGGVRLDVWEQVRGSGWFAQRNYLPAVAVAPTDAQGRTVLTGLGEDEHLTLVAYAAGYPQPNTPSGFAGASMPRVDSDDETFVLELAPARTVRWPLTDRDGPVPPDGTALTLRPRPGAFQIPLPDSARIEGGEVVAEGCSPGVIQAQALTPDGAIAQLYCRPDTEAGMEASFRPGRTVDVTVTLPDGTPAKGFWVVVRNQGNNPLHEPVPVDEQGHARIDGLYGKLAEVYVGESPASHGGQRAGTVNLQEGGGRFEVTVQPMREAVVTILLDGEPGLPPVGRLQGGTGAIRAARDPERGELRFRWRASAGEGGGLYLNYVAEGYTVGTVMLRPGDGPGPDRARMELRRAGTLVVRIAMPADGRVAPAAQYREEASGAWKPAPVYIPLDALGTDGVLRITRAPPGTYRVLDAISGAASRAVELTEGGATVQLEFDLGRVGDVRGHVRVPEGADAGTAHVEVIDVASGEPLPNPSGWPRGRVLQDDGLFVVRVPGDRDIRLVPRHPYLRAAPEGGSVTVKQPREGVVLRLVPGPTATLRLDPPPTFQAHIPATMRKLRVLLFAGPVGPKPVRTLEVRASDDGIRIGGFDPGTYTVWVDAPHAAPVILENVELGEGVTDLGTRAAPPGTTLRVRVLVKEGEAVPRLGLRAQHEGEPGYYRWVNSRGEAVIDLPGLGAGVHRITTHAQMGGLAKGLDETITVDGTGVVERVLDLR